jgi:hypothetical protein
MKIGLRIIGFFLVTGGRPASVRLRAKSFSYAA